MLQQVLQLLNKAIVSKETKISYSKLRKIAAGDKKYKLNAAELSRLEAFISSILELIQKEIRQNGESEF